MDRLLLVGLDEPEYEALKPRLDLPVVFHPSLPRIKLEEGVLLAERRNAVGRFLPVDYVIFHGIFEDDFDFLTGLDLWGGPCLPSTRGLLDARLRLPCLARSLRVTRFGAMKRGFGARGEAVEVTVPSVAKWGNWHCGENKSRFEGRWTCEEATVLEPFIHGEAVRVVLLGERAWQIRLAGDSWLKSIHHPDAEFMPLDPELLEDTRALAAHFGLELIGVDYMVGADGQKHLLEVNHIPNVTVFPALREAFLELASRWVEAQRASRPALR